MAVDKQKWIEALGRYEKHFGTFVPYKFDGEKYVLAKENCACALGVYLIEVMGVPADEIARTRGISWDKLFDMLEIEFGGEEFVRNIWQLNDETNYPYNQPRDETFGRVIEYIRFSL
jgi:hypothetical protein